MKTENRKVRLRLSQLFAGLLVFLFVDVRFAAADGGEIEVILSQRHFSSSLAELETAAGGKDELITKLLHLRHKESPPFVGLRAERLLLQFAEDERVSQALLADLRDYKLLGLARTIASNIDLVQEQSLRLQLSGEIIKRAKSEARFLPFARQLLNSGDPDVQSYAHKQLSPPGSKQPTGE